MKLTHCTSNIDVKNVRVCPNRTILSGVMALQRGAEIETTLYFFFNFSLPLVTYLSENRGSIS